MQSGAMAFPSDYDSNPSRFRLAARVLQQYSNGLRNPYDEIPKTLSRAGARLVADIGSGEGALSSALRHIGAMKVISVDYSAAQLMNCPKPKMRADALRLPFTSGTLDAAVAVNMLYHVTEPVVAIREAVRVLKPGGLFVAATVSRSDCPELASVWTREPSSFDAEEAPDLVRSVFTTVETKHWDAPLMTLPDTRAVSEFLLARNVSAGYAEAAAQQLDPPIVLSRRGVIVYARRLDPSIYYSRDFPPRRLGREYRQRSRRRRGFRGNARPFHGRGGYLVYYKGRAGLAASGSPGRWPPAWTCRVPQPRPDHEPTGRPRWPDARDQQHPRSTRREPSSPAARSGEAAPGPAPAACTATGPAGNDAATSSARKLPSTRGAPALVSRGRDLTGPARPIPPRQPSGLTAARPAVARSWPDRGPARDRHAVGGVTSDGAPPPVLTEIRKTALTFMRSAQIVTWQLATASGHV